MSQRRETPSNNADQNDQNPFFFTAVWDEGGVTQVALLNRADDLETARQILINYSPFLKSQHIAFEIDVPDRAGGSRRAGIPSESWSIVTKNCSDVFLKLSPIDPIEKNSISGEKTDTAIAMRSPKKEKSTPKTRPYWNQGWAPWAGATKGGSTTHRDPISTRGSKRATGRSSFCRQCIDRGVICMSRGASALICNQCVDNRLPCSLKPVELSAKKKPSNPRPSLSGFSPSPLAELDEGLDDEGSVFSVATKMDGNDSEYISGTEEE